MTDGKLLLRLIEESGMPKTVVAERSGFSRDRLYSIIDGSECRASEMEGLTKTLHLTSAVIKQLFFAKEVAKQTTSEDNL